MWRSSLFSRHSVLGFCLVWLGLVRFVGPFVCVSSMWCLVLGLVAIFTPFLYLRQLAFLWCRVILNPRHIPCFFFVFFLCICVSFFSKVRCAGDFKGRGIREAGGHVEHRSNNVHPSRRIPSVPRRQPGEALPEDKEGCVTVQLCSSSSSKPSVRLCMPRQTKPRKKFPLLVCMTGFFWCLVWPWRRSRIRTTSWINWGNLFKIPLFEARHIVCFYFQGGGGFNRTNTVRESVFAQWRCP